jgi:hypothetical protein
MSVPPPLLDALVDYAGLFPPAKLAMAEAVQNHAAYLTGPHGDMLGRFIVPLGNLAEFETAYAQLHSSARRGWRVSVIGTADPAADWSAINGFNSRHTEARIVSIEAKAGNAAEIARISAAFPPILEVWIELAPRAPDLPALLAAVKGAGRGAKLRTGGVTPEAFPAAADVGRFLRLSHEAGVVLKATAGLHHPLRGDYRLTYDPGSPQGRMFGFLNVFLGAALVRQGGTDPEVIALLEEDEARSFTVSKDEIVWRAHRFGIAQLAETRKLLCRSFGSCSFTEPVEGLQEISWL